MDQIANNRMRTYFVAVLVIRVIRLVRQSMSQSFITQEGSAHYIIQVAIEIE